MKDQDQLARLDAEIVILQREWDMAKTENSFERMGIIRRKMDRLEEELERIEEAEERGLVK